MTHDQQPQGPDKSGERTLSHAQATTEALPAPDMPLPTYEDSVKAVIFALRSNLPGMSAEERLDVFSAVQDGYCPACGDDRLPCHCQNDE